jgi:rSAM/selenodomain-associated transferase 2/rSAM/selenodomain-associated transferase 1
MDRALIIFTKIPRPGKTKTRMMPYLSGDECAALHFAFLRDIAADVSDLGAALYVAWTDPEEDPGSADSDTPGSGGADGPAELREIFPDAVFFRQEGDGLGIRMDRAMNRVLGVGHDSAVLIGVDTPHAVRAGVGEAFRLLEGGSDFVFGPAADGGYWLVGQKRPCREIYSLEKYSHPRVLEQTIGRIPDGESCSLLGRTFDVDDIGDLLRLRRLARTGSVQAAEGGDERLLSGHDPAEGSADRADSGDTDTAAGWLDARVGENTAAFLRDHHIISVIIPVYNEEKCLPAFLKELEKLGEACEVIFADGGSSDSTASLIRDRGFRLVESARGRGPQLNAGARASRGDILFFLHADAELPPDAAAEILEVSEKCDVGCFGIAFHSRNFFMWTNRVISNFRAKRRHIVFGDQGMFMDRDLFFRTGMFPPLPLMEDFRYSLDLRAAGLTFGMTRHRLYVSDRRYRGSTADKLRVMKHMYLLRRRFLAGEDIEKITREYPDVR